MKLSRDSRGYHRYPNGTVSQAARRAISTFEFQVGQLDYGRSADAVTVSSRSSLGMHQPRGIIDRCVQWQSPCDLVFRSRHIDDAADVRANESRKRRLRKRRYHRRRRRMYRRKQHLATRERERERERERGRGRDRGRERDEGRWKRATSSKATVFVRVNPNRPSLHSSTFSSAPIRAANT